MGGQRWAAGCPCGCCWVPWVPWPDGTPTLTITTYPPSPHQVLENSEGTEAGTLLAAINNCVTPAGRRRLRQWLCRPLYRIPDIVARQVGGAGLWRIARVWRAAPGSSRCDVQPGQRTTGHACLPQLHAPRLPSSLQDAIADLMGAAEEAAATARTLFKGARHAAQRGCPASVARLPCPCPAPMCPCSLTPKLAPQPQQAWLTWSGLWRASMLRGRAWGLCGTHLTSSSTKTCPSAACRRVGAERCAGLAAAARERMPPRRMSARAADWSLDPASPCCHTGVCVGTAGPAEDSGRHGSLCGCALRWSAAAARRLHAGCGPVSALLPPSRVPLGAPSPSLPPPQACRAP